MTEQQQFPSTNTPAQSHGPAASWRSGGLNVCIWDNQATDESGEQRTYQTISFERRYKDRNGQWQSTNSLRLNDLPRAILLLTKAYEHLLLGGEHEE